MQMLTGLLCVVGLTSAAKLNAPVDQAVAALAADMSSNKAALPGFNTDWFATAFGFPQPSYFNCEPGTAGPVNTFVRKGDPVSDDRGGSVTATLQMPKVNFDYGRCKLSLYITDSAKPYNGVSPGNEVILKLSLQDKKTHCVAKVLQLEMNYPKNLTIVEDDKGWKLMRSYGALDRCLDQLKKSVHEGVNAYYSTFVGKTYSLPTRC